MSAPSVMAVGAASSQTRPNYNPALGQWMTKPWVAEALIESEFSDLGPGDLVLEPTCGTGVFLSALPDNVRSVGIEIDPALAAIARAKGHQVIEGDVLSAPLPDGITAIVGNPPFTQKIIEAMLERLADHVPLGARAGFILPAYIHQTSSAVLRYSRRWGIDVRFLPRNLFQGIKMPLTWTLFTRDDRRQLHGFILYERCQEVRELDADVRGILEDPVGAGPVAGATAPTRSVWAAAVSAALQQLGGAADLQTLYAALEKRPPSLGNSWPREKIRQTLQRWFVRLDDGRWGLYPVNGAIFCAA